MSEKSGGLPPSKTGPRGRIRLLPDHLVDQIAAGEVVERPASVVKELVENVLDADARRLRVEIRDGGRALIAVTDDGCGMDAENAPLALERHATSKIASGDDLVRIASFGFRGEALAAIASVSQLRLRTRARGAAEGLELRVEGGKLLEARAAGGPEGTRVEVADLFLNVPARRKFLKTAATEWGHIADWLGRVALVTPDVHFDVMRDERPAVHWPAVTDPLDRVSSVLSEREAEGLVRLEAALGDARLEGFASRPDAHRTNAAGVYLFVNGRPVRDRLLRHALLSVYRDLLPRGRFPTALLFLSLPPEAVDVNVHPAKAEVRFADPGAIHGLVTRGVRDALAKRSWISTAPSRQAPEPALRDFGRAAPPLAGTAQPRRGGAPGPSDWVLAGERGGRADAVGERPERLRFAELAPLGQLLASYLVLEASDGLVLVDQHAAHERVLYERLRAAWREGGVARQPLLTPETVELSAAQAVRLGASQTALEAVGFEVESFGENAVAVRAIPALLAGRNPADLVRELADELAAQPVEWGDTAAGEGAPAERSQRLDAVDRLFASLACHSARRAGDRLEPAEQSALLEALDGIPWSPTCPHGRPVALPVTLAEIERRFGRA